MLKLINVPGIGGSGPEHWQSIWELLSPEMRRIKPDNWDEPDLVDWKDALELAVREAGEAPLLVAHSLGCLLLAHWQACSQRPVLGAFMVAPPDPDSPSFPTAAVTFRDPPRSPLRFPSAVIASTDDPYASVDFARSIAKDWQAQFILTRDQGHLNGQSGIGAWPEGSELLDRFAAAWRT